MIELSLFDDKVVILVTMLITTICFGLIPKRLVRAEHQGSTRLKIILSLLNCFSGGVFIAACLLDLFPDVRESIDHVLDEIERRYHTTVDYPVAEFIIVIGFFIVLITEQIVLSCKENQTTVVEVNSAPSERDPLITRNSDSGSINNDSHGTFGPLSTLDEDDETHHHENEDHDHGHHSVAHMFEHSTLRAILLLLALSFHSLFEGLAIGLQVITGELISLFTAVIVHKSIMAFSLGLTMAQSRLSSRSFLISIMIFSIASPIGMAFGIALTGLKESIGRDIANGILQGISGGTFLYITFFEVLPHELNKTDMRMLRVLSVLLGFTAICGLLFITH